MNQTEVNAAIRARMNNPKYAAGFSEIFRASLAPRTVSGDGFDYIKAGQEPWVAALYEEANGRYIDPQSLSWAKALQGKPGGSMGFLGSFGDFISSAFSDAGDAVSDVVSTVSEGVSEFVQSAADPNEGLPFVAAFAAVPTLGAALGAGAAVPASQSLMAATLPSAYATTTAAAVPAATAGASIWDSIVTTASDAWSAITGSSAPVSSQYALGTPNLASSASALPNVAGTWGASTSQYALSGSLPNVGAGAGGFWESISRTAGDMWNYGGDIVKKLTTTQGSVKPLAATGAKPKAAAGAVPAQTGIMAAVGQSGMMLPLLALGALAIFWMIKK